MNPGLDWSDHDAQSGQNIDAAQALAAAVAQIALAVRDVQPPVDHLGSLIDNMATGIRELRASRPRNADPEAISVFPDEYDRALSSLEAELNGSITQLQFYDRMVQHLTHVQDYLSSIAEQLTRQPDTHVGDDIFGTLRGKLRSRLISAAQRELLDMMLPPPQGARSSSRQAREEHAAQGNVELF